MLVEHLPPESATHTALRVAAGDDATGGADSGGDPAEGRWSHTEMLLAAILDAIRGLQWTYVAAHSKRRPSPPEPTRRPGAGRPPVRPRELTVADYRRLTGESPPPTLVNTGG